MKINLYSCDILIKIEFSLQSFELISGIKFHKNPSNGTKLFHAETQTEGGANKLAD